MTQGILLLAHGSRDPQWQRPMEAVAARIRALDPQARVGCAYLELTAPDLPAAAAALIAEGACTIRVLPLFLGIGKHAREDLPRKVAELRRSHPEVVFELQPAVGEDARLVELLARIALS
ncbi:sirohydrochlorin chelatase [Variovorax terrae]|uniref:CbiX/SirB N-terminal domain-containing protein n=1 Tax=Variovorax terrae TaxID=2923278 RepID=A0A9X1VTU4_9BURK|nr:CbiX/SirB N-terminal domain-containing protein [Variovorax terrae]MCJ0763182.1 CbiX/SirB N-terminal domain-containing protein [Variovorax terrae]